MSLRRSVVRLAATVLPLSAVAAPSPAGAALGTPYQDYAIGTSDLGVPELTAVSRIGPDVGFGVPVAGTAGARLLATDGVLLPSVESAATGDFFTDASGTGFVAVPGAGAVRVVSPAGRVERSYDVPGGAALAVDPAAPGYGHGRVLYVLGSSGVSVLDPSQHDTSTGSAAYLAAFPTRPAASIAVAPDHTLLLLDPAADEIYRYTDQGTRIGSYPVTGDGTAAVDPAGFTVDSKGVVFIADKGNDRVLEMSVEGDYLGSFGDPNSDSDPTDGPGAGQFDGPTDVAVDCRGGLWVLDTRSSGTSRIVHFSGAAAPTGRCAALPVHSAVTDRQAGQIGVDDAGDVYTTAYGQLRKYDADGRLITSWGTPSTTPKPHSWGFPAGFAVGPSGEVFIASYLFGTDHPNGTATVTAGTPQVLEYTAAGRLVRDWTSEPGMHGSASVPLQSPRGIAVRRSDGHVFVGDARLREVQEFDGRGHFVRAYVPHPLVDAPTQIGLQGVAVDSAGNLLVAVSQNTGAQFDSPATAAAERWSPSGRPLGDIPAPAAAVGSADVSGIEPLPDGHLVWLTYALSYPAGVPAAMVVTDGTGAPLGQYADGLLHGNSGRFAVDCAGRLLISDYRLDYLRVGQSSRRCRVMPKVLAASIGRSKQHKVAVAATVEPEAQATRVRLRYGTGRSLDHSTRWVVVASDNAPVRRVLKTARLASGRYRVAVEVSNLSGTVTGRVIGVRVR